LLRELIQELYREPLPFDLRMNFPRDYAGTLLERYGAGRLLGRLPKWVRLRGHARELPFPAGQLAGPLLRIYGAAASSPRPRLPVEEVADLGPEFDALAQASASFAPCIRRRDAAYLRWRWLEQPGRRFSLTAVRASGGALRGFAVFDVQELPAGRRGRIVDLLAADGLAMRALLCDAFDRLAQAGCQRVVCDYHDPRPWSRTAFLRSGFLPVHGDINVICGAMSARCPRTVERLEGWYLTRGDTDLA
jgi:hypothetical protein